MLEQRECPTEGLVVRLPCGGIKARHLQVREDRHQQVVLVREMGIEGRASDIRPVDDVLDRNPS